MGTVVETLEVKVIVPSSDARRFALLSFFDALDERGQLTTLALIATAAKLHPKAK